MNGQTPACDITDVNGNFRFTIPLIDLQGGSSTPDVLIKVFFENDDFKIIRQDYNSVTKSVNQNTPATVH